MRMLFVALSFAFAGGGSAQQAPKDDPAPTTPEQAQQQRQLSQPGNNAPVWREVQRGDPNYTSIPGREMNVLIQPPARFLGQDVRVTAGEAWRQFRNGPMTFYGGWLVVVVLLDPGGALLRLRAGQAARPAERPADPSLQLAGADRALVHRDQLLRAGHLRPDDDVRQVRAAADHRLHAVRAGSPRCARTCTTSSAPFFIVSVLVFIVLFIRDNLPRAYDFKWFCQVLGLRHRQGKHVPSGKFNAGEKVWFWGGVVGALHRGGVERRDPAVPELRPVARGDAGRLDLARGRGAALHRDVARPHLPRHARAWKAPTRRCAPATSTRCGRRSTTRSGTTK